MFSTTAGSDLIFVSRLNLSVVTLISAILLGAAIQDPFAVSQVYHMLSLADPRGNSGLPPKLVDIPCNSAIGSRKSSKIRSTIRHTPEYGITFPVSGWSPGQTFSILQACPVHKFTFVFRRQSIRCLRLLLNQLCAKRSAVQTTGVCRREVGVVCCL